MTLLYAISIPLIVVLSSCSTSKHKCAAYGSNIEPDVNVEIDGVLINKTKYTLLNSEAVVIDSTNYNNNQPQPTTTFFSFMKAWIREEEEANEGYIREA